MANYHVKNQKVYAKIANLTEKELSAVKNYLALGFVLVESKEVNKKITNKAFTAKAIQEFLEEKGTKEQNKIYWEKYNEPVIDKETGEYKKTKKGDIKKKGHIATLRWFKSEFPDYGK